MRRFQSTLVYAFDKINHTNRSIKHTGLFGYQGLESPQGLERAAQECVAEANDLVDKVINAKSDVDVRKTIKRVDTISDILCSVLDASELIRHVHPNQEFVDAANKASTMLHSFLNQLNTHPGLYQSLKTVFDRREMKLGEQERKVASLLLQDFEKSGVHMPLKVRQKFIELNDSILQLGQEFAINSYPSEEYVSFGLNELKGVHPRLIQDLTRSSKVHVPTQSMIASMVLRTAEEEETRKKLFLAMNSATDDQVGLLEEFLRKRAELAQLLEEKSYGHLYLADKMAGSPENVQLFLNSMVKASTPLAMAELDALKKVKQAKTGKNDFHAWDRYFFAQFLQKRPEAAQSPISSYFTVGNVFEGLSEVFKSLYGVRLEVQDTISGEVWHPDVRKLSVVHETEGTIGTIYCDLFYREGDGARKYDNPAHFTVRCCRRIDNDEPEVAEKNWRMTNKKMEREVVVDGQVKRYQMPIVVLVTSFNRPHNGVPGLLDLQDIETLFHEMGHAMHSMLSQTDFQHISGTRVAMDFVEVPSILMEYFSKLPSLLQKMGKHYKTGEPVPMSLIELKQSNQHLLNSLETQNQLQMALLDQMYHSDMVLGDFDSSKILYDLSARMNPIPMGYPTRSQVQFSHLFTYGASYYSYLWSRRWASRIYRQHFENKRPEEWRIGGHLLRHEVLGRGGGRNPWIGLERIGVVTPDHQSYNDITLDLQ